MLAPGLATMLVVLTTDAGPDAAERWTPRCAPPPGSPSTGSTPTAACRRTTPVALLGSGASGITPDAHEFTAALTEVCRDAGAGSCSGMPRARPTTSHRGRERGDRGRRRRGRPRRRPQQPVQGRDLRQRPQLGPGARRGRHDRRRVRPVRHRRHDQRRPGVPRRAGRTSRANSSTSPRGPCTCSSTWMPATRAATHPHQRPHPRLRAREQRVRS